MPIDLSLARNGHIFKEAKLNVEIRQRTLFPESCQPVLDERRVAEDIIHNLVVEAIGHMYHRIDVSIRGTRHQKSIMRPRTSQSTHSSIVSDVSS